MLAIGSGGAKPFASRISIRGGTWTENGEEDVRGKKRYERIGYVHASPTQVAVKIEISPDKKHWKTILAGSGVKQR